MPIFMNSLHGAGFASLPSAVRDCTQQVTQLVQDRYREEETGLLSAETMLATTAALTGTMIRRAHDDLAKPKHTISANEFLEEAAAVVQDILDGKGAAKGLYAPFDDFFSHTLKNKNYKNSLVLTNDPYHTPHEDPAIGAAALREDVFFLGQTLKLDSHALATACMYSLAQTAGQTATAMPADVVYKMAMEVVVGSTYMNPLDRALVPVPSTPVISRRIVAAGGDLCEIFLKQSHSLAGGEIPHMPTMVAKAGSFLGEMTHKAFVKQGTTADYISSAAADTFLEECNIHIMASYIRRGGDAEELAEYGEYVANAAASFGHTPYPKHNVKKKYLPHSCPAEEAAFARKPAEEIVKKYNLLDWEMASACLPLVNDHVRIAERYISTPVAVRLAMEEAVAMARINPVDWDNLMTNAPKNIHDNFLALKKKAAYGASSGYPYSLDAILNQLLPR